MHHPHDYLMSDKTEENSGQSLSILFCLQFIYDVYHLPIISVPYYCILWYSEAENKFFLGHEVFCACDPRLWGVNQLSKKLTALLVSRIQLQLVPMKAHVEKNLGDYRYHFNEICFLNFIIISMLCYTLANSTCLCAKWNYVTPSIPC